MTWPTAIGVLGFSGAVISGVFVMLWIVRRCLMLGSDANDSRSAQIDAEHFKHEAEEQRDHALGEIFVLTSRTKQLEQQLEQARVLLEKHYQKLKENVDAVSDADLLDLSNAVMGLRAKVPTVGGTSPTTPVDDPTSTEAVRAPGTT